MYDKTNFVFSSNGDPFHGAGTMIYREADGELTYECPHCGRGRVPKRDIEALKRYAIRRND